MSGVHQPQGYLPLLEIARGGIGRVELCVRREGAFERLYAVKRLHPHLRDDDEFRTMFLDEARIAGLLRHANVISVVDVGEDREGPFLVMDYVDGIPLRDLMRTAGPSNLLPLSVCVEIALQVARGLHAAHELRSHRGELLNLIHRDVSPQNIMVGFDGTVRVGDFGIAKALGQRSQTSTGILKGKTGYFSPEQLRFEEIDRRSDLFSLGIVLYELVSGRRLYGGTTGTDVFRRILHEPVPELGAVRRDVSPLLEELVFDLLAKQPQDRPDSAQSVADRLSQLGLSADAADAITLEEFLGERFRQVREEKHQRLASAMEGVTTSRRHLRAGTGHTQAAIAVGTRTSKRPRRPVWMVLVAGIALGGAAVGVPAVFFAESTRKSDGFAVRADKPPANAPSVTSLGEPEPGVATTLTGVSGTVAEETNATAADPTPMRRAEAATRARRRARALRRRRRPPRREAQEEPRPQPNESGDLWWSVDSP